MREVLSLNAKWAFTKNADAVPTTLPEKWDFVNIPHSWNAIDGQDGDNDYFRGTGYYAKAFSKMELPEAERYYLEIRGANSSADVYLNSKKLAHHDGGYSTWRVDLTDSLEAMNLLVITVAEDAEVKISQLHAIHRGINDREAGDLPAKSAHLLTFPDFRVIERLIGRVAGAVMDDQPAELFHIDPVHRISVQQRGQAAVMILVKMGDQNPLKACYTQPVQIGDDPIGMLRYAGIDHRVFSAGFHQDDIAPGSPQEMNGVSHVFPSCSRSSYRKRRRFSSLACPRFC